MAEEEWEYQVRHRAYELWNAAGRPDGEHLQFWEAAERELKKTRVASNGLFGETEMLAARPDDKPANHQ